MVGCEQVFVATFDSSYHLLSGVNHQVLKWFNVFLGQSPQDAFIGKFPFESYVFKLIGCLKWAVDPRRSPSLRMGFIPDAPRHCA